MGLVAYGRQALRLGVVIVEADVELLVKLVDQVLHRLEAHHLREILQLREVFPGDGGQGDGGGGGAGGGVGGVMVQLIHPTRPQILKLLIQTHERGFHGGPRQVDVQALRETEWQSSVGCFEFPQNVFKGKTRSVKAQKVSHDFNLSPSARFINIPEGFNWRLLNHGGLTSCGLAPCCLDKEGVDVPEGDQVPKGPNQLALLVNHS